MKPKTHKSIHVMKIYCESCGKEIRGKIHTTIDDVHLCTKCLREFEADLEYDQDEMEDIDHEK